MTKGPRVNANPKPLRIRDMSEESCLYCQEKGHWKRDCPKYREDCAKGIVTDGKLFSNVHVIEINSTNQIVWILDTGCGSHLCNRVQGLRNPRPLAKGEVDLGSEMALK